MRETTAARKYAEALFLEAQNHKQILACRQGLSEIARVARLRKSLTEILSHPFISAREKKSMIHTALGEYATPLLERFLNILVQKRRFNLLPLIVQEFQDEVDRSENVQALQVKTAYPISDAQQKQLQQKLEKWLQSKVRMDLQVDPQLIGGLVIRTRDEELDQSIQGQLRRMRHNLVEIS